MPPDNLLEHILCCPVCQRWPLDATLASLSCGACGWQSQIVEKDTLSFIPDMKNETDAIRSASSPLRRSGIGKWIRVIHRRLVPWRQWLFRDADFWEHAIKPLRAKELETSRRLIAQVMPARQPVMVELGVGSRDNKALYAEVAEQAICSDIYRDPAAVRAYSTVSWAYYCLISVAQLPLRTASIDFLFTSHVVEHFPNCVYNLLDLRRILKPNGIACHIVPIATGFMLGHLVGTIVNMLTLTPYLGRGVHGEYTSVWQELQATTVRGWQTLFEKCGFEVVCQAPGALGIPPLLPSTTMWMTKHLKIYGSWVFLTRAS